MTRREAATTMFRQMLRWWPLIIVPTLIAVGASVWSASHQTPSYTATTKLVVIPLAQSDETFLGTSLIRDGGDPSRTAATVATELDSERAAAATADYLGDGWTPDAVRAAVQIQTVDTPNVIDIAARSPDPARAEKLAAGFARTTLADRWKTISAELDARIALLNTMTDADPNAGGASARLQTIEVIRQRGSDPTLRIDSTTSAVPEHRLPMAATVGTATAGGLFVGLLAALGLSRLRRRTPSVTAEPAYASSGGR